MAVKLIPMRTREHQWAILPKMKLVQLFYLMQNNLKLYRTWCCMSKYCHIVSSCNGHSTYCMMKWQQTAESCPGILS
uniref:Uncharacterized protein n=1 Tax=Rhizophora mucronata TaxID=61149 RepID=A0A2P2NGQ9_RHIMU